MPVYILADGTISKSPPTSAAPRQTTTIEQNDQSIHPDEKTLKVFRVSGEVYEVPISIRDSKKNLTRQLPLAGSSNIASSSNAQPTDVQRLSGVGDIQNLNAKRDSDMILDVADAHELVANYFKTGSHGQDDEDLKQLRRFPYQSFVLCCNDPDSDQFGVPLLDMNDDAITQTDSNNNFAEQEHEDKEKNGRKVATTPLFDRLGGEVLLVVRPEFEQVVEFWRQEVSGIAQEFCKRCSYTLIEMRLPHSYPEGPLLSICLAVGLLLRPEVFLAKVDEALIDDICESIRIESSYNNTELWNLCRYVLMIGRESSSAGSKTWKTGDPVPKGVDVISRDGSKIPILMNWMQEMALTQRDEQIENSTASPRRTMKSAPQGTGMTLGSSSSAISNHRINNAFKSQDDTRNLRREKWRARIQQLYGSEYENQFCNGSNVGDQNGLADSHSHITPVLSSARGRPKSVLDSFVDMMSYATDPAVLNHEDGISYRSVPAAPREWWVRVMCDSVDGVGRKRRTQDDILATKQAPCQDWNEYYLFEKIPIEAVHLVKHLLRDPDVFESWFPQHAHHRHAFSYLLASWVASLVTLWQSYFSTREKQS